MRRLSFTTATVPEWVIAIAAVVGALGGVFLFYEERSLRKFEAVQKLHQEYLESSKDLKLEEPLVDENQRKQIVTLVRCEVIRDSINGDSDMNCDDNEKSRSLTEVELSSELKAKLRERMQDSLGKLEIQKDKAGMWLYSFDPIRVCVEQGNCDKETASKLFGKELTSFLNEVCAHVFRGNSLKHLEIEIKALAQLLLDTKTNHQTWSEDKGRESLFFCSELRDLRPRYGFLSWLRFSPK